MSGSSLRWAAALVLLAATPALADDQEASVALEAGPAFVRLAELHDDAATTTVAGGSAALRLSYGLSDLVALDLAVGGTVALNAEFHHLHVDTVSDGNILQDERAIRATTGVSLRFGARWIPFLGLHVGYQHHTLGNAVLFKTDGDTAIVLRDLPARDENDLLASAELGLERRLDRHWIFGVAAQLAYAHGLGGNSVAALELPVRLTYSFYPGWFRSMRVTRFGD